jgi:hypothetical protein
VFEGAPKESHKIIVALGVAAGIVMFLSSFDGGVFYETSTGRDVFRNDGAEWAKIIGLAIAILLATWHRGIIVGIWPLPAGFAAAILVFGLAAGDWITGVRYASDEGTSVNAMFVATVLGSLTAATVCLIGLFRPVVERSRPAGSWSSRQAGDG